MRALCAAILVPVLLLSLMAEAKAAPAARPLSRRDLIRVVPECAHAGPIRAPACRKAADILDSSPQQATQIYLQNWRRTALGSAPGSSSHGGGGGGGGSFGNLGGLGNGCNPGGNAGEAFVAIVVIVIAIVVIVVVVALIVQGVKELHRANHDARIRAADRITTRALRAVYQQSAGDPYADRMLQELSLANYGSESSWLRFSEADRAANPMD